MKRFFDLMLSILTLALLLPLFMLLALLIKASSKGPIIYWSDRLGRDGKIFKMAKFRTMQVGTPVVATHLLENSQVYLTPVGSFFRRTSLDELPQLWNTLIGDMSFVGPRPALFNQSDLIALRAQHGIDRLLPGITGWAQVNGRDELNIALKVQYELDYLKMQSLWFDIKILGLTLIKVIRQAGISH